MWGRRFIISNERTENFMPKLSKQILILPINSSEDHHMLIISISS